MASLSAPFGPADQDQGKVVRVSPPIRHRAPAWSGRGRKSATVARAALRPRDHGAARHDRIATQAQKPAGHGDAP
jgi:hypothetical protein